jgi:hypothetical protein
MGNITGDADGIQAPRGRRQERPSKTAQRASASRLKIAGRAMGRYGVANRTTHPADVFRHIACETRIPKIPRSPRCRRAQLERFV